MKTQRRVTLGYMPSLDGLRGVAVAAVVTFHFLPRLAGGGYVGVDMFFVLSGYLITSLLLAERDETGGIVLRAFWARRARRLLPALFLVLLAVALWSALALDGQALDRVRRDGLATLFYSANWYNVLGGQAYVDRFDDPSPLFHTWSLAIEEQFYVLWPLVVVACIGLFRRWRRALFALVALATVVSVALVVLLYTPADIYRAYQGTDARAQQLLIGVLLAVALRRASGRRLLERFGPSALGTFAAVVVVMVILLAPGPEEGAFWFRGGSVLIALATAAVIAAGVARARSPVKAVLELPPLVWLGTISYGVYLWHVPVQVAVTHSSTGLSGPAVTALRVALTLSFAALSFYLVEQPIRHGALGVRAARLATPIAVAGVAAALVVGTTIR